MRLFHLLLLLVFIVAAPLMAAPEKKLYHDIKISNMLINEASLRCSKEVFVLIDIENEGTFTEDMYVELINKPLSVHAFSSPVQVAPRSREQVLIPLYFNEEPQGAYTFDAYLYADKDIQEAFQTVTFAGCKTVKLTSYIQDPPPVTVLQQSSPQHDEAPVDWLLVGTLFLVILLVLLACTAILRLL